MSKISIIAALAWLALCLAPGRAPAQTSTGQVPSDTENLSMDDYLDLLDHISPAARDGAQDYLDAVRRRCDRALTVLELRHAISTNDGDPVLMAMIHARASIQRAPQNAALQQLAQRVRCDARSRP